MATDRSPHHANPLGPLLLSAALAVTAGNAVSAEDPDALPPVLRPAGGVRDAGFAILVGLITDNRYGTLTGERLKQELHRLRKRSRIPANRLKSLTRSRLEDGKTALVRLELTSDAKLDLPYTILGYHPGNIIATRVTLFQEWMFGGMSIPRFHAKPLAIEEVHLFGLLQGSARVDLDGWLDWLLGSAADDTLVSFLMLCRYRGRWLGFGMGYNKDRKGRSGTLDFARNRLLFPTPKKLRSIGPSMRRFGERLAAATEKQPK